MTTDTPPPSEDIVPAVDLPPAPVAPVLPLVNRCTEIRRTIPAKSGASVGYSEFNAVGAFVFVKEADGIFRVALDAEPDFEMAAGMSYTAPADRPFSRIELMNPTAAAINVVLLVGVGSLEANSNATGSASVAHVIATADTNARSVKASMGRVLGWHFHNLAAAPRFVKLHNTAGVPTAGVGVVQTIGIPAGGVSTVALDVGIGYPLGIGLTIVAGYADADATACAAGDVVGDLIFQ